MLCTLDPSSSSRSFCEGDFLLFHDQTVGLVWRSGPDKVAHECQRESDDGVDDERPAPSWKTVEAVEIPSRSSLKKTGRHGSESKTGVKDASSSANLVTSIARTQHKVNNREI